jgi:hypothetical protein
MMPLITRKVSMPEASPETGSDTVRWRETANAIAATPLQLLSSKPQCSG